MTRIIAITLASAVFVLAVACGGSDPVEPPPSPSPLAAELPTVAPTEEPATPTSEPVATATSPPAPTPTEVAVATAPPADTPTPVGYDSNVAMYDIFPSFSLVPPDLEEILDEVVAENDQSLVPFLVEILRFMPSRRSNDMIGQALRELTGQDYASEDWDAWMDWVGQNSDLYEPPSEYATWKAESTPPSTREWRSSFVLPKEFSRIDLTEVVWGGVRTDGIPDLRSPRVLTPDEADYMEPGRQGLRGPHQRREQSVPSAYSQRPRDGERHSWRRADLADVVNALRHRNRVFREDRRRAHHLWNVRTAVSLQQADVRPPHQHPLEFPRRQTVIGKLAMRDDLVLDYFPVALTTWQEWLEEHPDTGIISNDTGYYTPRFYQPESDNQVHLLRVPSR